MTGDPVSWLLIEPGWPVYDARGEKVGKVEEVLADEQADIFHGLLVERALGDDEEVLAERVAEIHEGHLHLSCRRFAGAQVAAASLWPCSQLSGPASTPRSRGRDDRLAARRPSIWRVAPARSRP